MKAGVLILNSMFLLGTDKLSLIKSQWCNEKNKKPVQTSPLSS
jgi:hypothetical protein